MMKTYIVRVNLDIKGTKEDAKSIRFKSAVKSIESLHKSNTKVVILSHRGRPEGIDKSLSLKGIKDLLEKAMAQKITFFGNFDFPSVREKIKSSPGGSIFMLENIRFLKGEQENDPKLAKDLASLGDVFVNDDFATAHRENASNVGITKFIPHRPGVILKREIDVLQKAMIKPKHPFVLIIGGAKISDKMGVIKNLCDRMDSILLGGGPANTVLKSTGANIGGSIYEPEMLKDGKKFSCEEKIIIPLDYKKKGNRILDIGPKTIKIYSDIIKRAKMVIWSGPMGLYEKKGFEKGSFEIAKAITKSKAFSIIGGGDTAEVMVRAKLDKRVGLLSTGGGAMLEYLSGKKLPALVALKRNKS